MKAVSGKRFCKLLEDKGWKLKRINGNHPVPNTDSFKEISKIHGLGYGGCAVFKTNWR